MIFASWLVFAASFPEWLTGAVKLQPGLDLGAEFLSPGIARGFEGLRGKFGGLRETLVLGVGRGERIERLGIVGPGQFERVRREPDGFWTIPEFRIRMR